MSFIDPDTREEHARQAERDKADRAAKEAVDRARPRLTIVLMPTDDVVLTCCICGAEDCDFEFQSRARGRKSFIGIHGRCARDTGDTVNVP